MRKETTAQFHTTHVILPDCLDCSGLTGTHHGLFIRATPRCFQHDAQACINGSTFRPLPPAWLLVGAAGSGTPIHDHPSTAAWVPLLSGTKAWVLLPPDVDPAALLLMEVHFAVTTLL